MIVKTRVLLYVVGNEVASGNFGRMNVLPVAIRSIFLERTR